MRNIVFSLIAVLLFCPAINAKTLIEDDVRQEIEVKLIRQKDMSGVLITKSIIIAVTVDAGGDYIRTIELDVYDDLTVNEKHKVNQVIDRAIQIVKSQESIP